MKQHRHETGFTDRTLRHAGPAQRSDATGNQADGGVGATCRASIGRRGAALGGGDINRSMQLDILMYLLRSARSEQSSRGAHAAVGKARRNGRPSGCSRSDPWAEGRALAKAKRLK